MFINKLSHFQDLQEVLSEHQNLRIKIKFLKKKKKAFLGIWKNSEAIQVS